MTEKEHVLKKKECFNNEHDGYSYMKNITGTGFQVVDGVNRLYAAKISGDERPEKQLLLKSLEITKAGDPFDRLSAIRILAQVGGEEAFQRIIELVDDKELMVRASAIHALEHFPDDPLALETLLRLLKSEEIEEKWCAVVVLGRLHEKSLLPVLMDELAIALRSKRLWETFENNEEMHAGCVMSLFDAVLTLGEKSVIPQIISFLEHPEPSMVLDAARLLIQHEIKVPREILVSLSGNENSEIQNNAASLLAETEGVEAWKDALYSQEYSKRHHAARLLAERGGSEGKQLLRKYLEDGDDLELRLSLLTQLEAIQNDLLFSILEASLAHHWPTMRFRAAAQLFRIPAQEAKSLAQEALQDEPDALIRKTLERVLSLQ
ncbi:MAG: HEAT repeat domain-containing protein [Candidatus Eremiobacteraeota bacterium]|nr:HEAT repeat domain-containing protein [Candidatus Eremiobacteraeota bacterium]